MTYTTLFKRICSLLGLVLYSVNSSLAQQWCTPGTAWTYTFNWRDRQGNLRIEYSRDTLLSGKECQILSKQVFFKYEGMTWNQQLYTRRLPDEIIYTEANQVHVYAHQQFYKLYDFASQPGDTWTLPGNSLTHWCPELVRVVVDSVGSEIMDKRQIRWFRAHLQWVAQPQTGSFLYGFRGRIYEGIGPSKDYLFPNGITEECGQIFDVMLGGLLMRFMSPIHPIFYPTPCLLENTPLWDTPFSNVTQ